MKVINDVEFLRQVRFYRLLLVRKLDLTLVEYCSREKDTK